MQLQVRFTVNSLRSEEKKRRQSEHKFARENSVVRAKREEKTVCISKRTMSSLGGGQNKTE